MANNELRATNSVPICPQAPVIRILGEEAVAKVRAAYSLNKAARTYTKSSLCSSSKHVSKNQNEEQTVLHKTEKYVRIREKGKLG